jgi:hypothetical protein
MTTKQLRADELKIGDVVPGRGVVCLVEDAYLLIRFAGEVGKPFHCAEMLDVEVPEPTVADYRAAIEETRRLFDYGWPSTAIDGILRAHGIELD